MTPDLPALAYHWEAWARPKQLAPPTAWRSFGLVTGRGFGKTRSLCELVVAEVQAGRAMNIAFAAQNLDETERTMIHGPSGLLACSPPWFPAETVKGIVCWPNGARATPLTPEVPAGPRGGDRDLLWCSEVAAWPASSRDEFFSNMRLSLRRGLGRMIYDTTPRARNPIVRYLLERAAREPHRHVVVRGSSLENADNLTPGVVEEWLAEYGGTQKGREELDGVFFDDEEGALWKQPWIDDHRRDMPAVFKRRILSVDIAISMRKGTDATGIVELGLGVDDQVFVVDDMTERMAPEVWAPLLIDRYFAIRADCIVFERNRGGDLIASTLRAVAATRGIRVEVVGSNAVTRHVAGTIYVKETHARKSKALRADPVATAYERGRVSHVRGADLTELEDQMTTWVPDAGGESPNALDALVHGVFELLDLGRETAPDGSAAVRGAAAMQAALGAAPARKPVNVAVLLGGRGGGDRI